MIRGHPQYPGDTVTNDLAEAAADDADKRRACAGAGHQAPKWLPGSRRWTCSYCFTILATSQHTGETNV